MALKLLIHITSYCVKHSHGTGLLNPGLFWIRFWRSYTQQRSDHDRKMEKVSQLRNLGVMRMDIGKVRKRNILGYTIARETFEQFLLDKGADSLTIASIISRFPRAVTCRSKDLAEIWNIWGSILGTDADVLMVVDRSPESFFRSGGIEKLSGNISFFQSLGFPPTFLQRLMLKSPRTFSYSVRLNKDKVAFFRELCVRLGGEHPENFIRHLFTSNIYILSNSSKRLKTSIESIQSIMKLEDKDLLSWIQGQGASILNSWIGHIEENFLGIQQKMQSLGLLEAEITQYLYKNPKVLCLTPLIFTAKVNLLLECDVEPRKMLDTRLIKLSLDSLQSKINLLKQYGYDMKSKGLWILELPQSQIRNILENTANRDVKNSQIELKI